MARRSLTAWVAKASPYDVLSLAVEMERAACREYMRLARHSENRLARAKFRYLAEEERDHVRALGAALRGMPTPAKRAATPTGVVAEGAPESDSVEAAVRFALADERRAAKFYRACAGRCRSAATQRVFEQLADQEEHHGEVLSAELAMMGASYAWSSIEGAPPLEGDFWT